MSDDVRPWMEEGAPEGVRALLESAQLDEPTTAQLASLKAKLLPLFPPAGGGGDGGQSGGEGAPQDGGASGAGASGSGVSASGAASAGAPAAATTGAVAAGGGTVLASGVAKTVLAVALSSAVVGAGSFYAGVEYQRAQGPVVVQAPVQPVAQVEPPPPPPPVAPEPVAPVPVTPVAAPPKRVVKAVEPPKPPPPPAPTTGVPSNEEVALLQQAMDALKGGRPADALGLLDTYPARFPSGVLQQEAEVLSIEALVKKGDLSRAQERSRAFREKWPTSTHLIRLDSLLRGK